MGSVKDYFKGFGMGLRSLVQGMEVTGKEFLTKKVTEKYPENRDNVPVAPRFRAILTLTYDAEGRHKCISCGMCQRSCPNGTINIESKMVELADGKKKKQLVNWMYDLGSCTFCQLCVTNCPTGAITFSNDFEQSVFTRELLVKKLNYLPEPPIEPAPAPAQPAAPAEPAK
ncbi:MAG: NADH-quinone oxidoreductase subunit I [Muribaculaceae bacterium]|nr:NADH-quinone oxidoreductase subunit I [Muribaculaceae bacterium]MDE5659705.1 NADH-quinone oxidoreductase subunit I [Muribaculaceae bacterium]MDE6166354.1 NADH-quinone oxidoreductase subunit I [Muribaculaceae bacterium]